MAPEPDGEALRKIDDGPTEGEIDAAIAEFGGDARETVRALLRDIATLAADADRLVSHGFVRRHLNLVKGRQ
ncbi:hypothetical protein [Phreatobacter stygius]|uniref:Uncharacterized protein n=1 Tax=Phreatobacter stygius TaxID=1940610 RepID=A0A4D7B1K4_9HYPH|nr:hypothetical protein [Phreatobacter stygius]QCI65295.1 hypothetical protein E8M01_14390 [Phreatobacter stygius]